MRHFTAEEGPYSIPERWEDEATRLLKIGWQGRLVMGPVPVGLSVVRLPGCQSGGRASHHRTLGERSSVAPVGHHRQRPILYLPAKPGRSGRAASTQHVLGLALSGKGRRTHHQQRRR